MNTAHATFPRRLETLRQRVYRRLVVYGVLAVACGGVYAFLTAVFLDWWLQLPPAPRVVGAAAFIVGFGAASLHWIYKPWRSRIGMEDVAGRLETYFPQLNGRLNSSVCFIRSPELESSALMRRVIANTDGMTTDLPLENVLTMRPLVAVATLLALSAGLLGAVSVAAPRWASIGLRRYLSPFDDVEWPRRVHILSLTRDLKTPIGESAEVRMRVTQGLSDTLRGVAHVVDGQGVETRLTMRRDGDVFSAVIEPVTQDLTYWFEAGDDHTRRRPGHVIVVRRPEVIDVTAFVTPPAYVGVVPPSARTLSAKPLQVPRGGVVQLTIHSSQPVDRRAPGRLRFDDGATRPLDVDPHDATRLHAAFDVTRDLAFRVFLRDPDGYESLGGIPYALIASPDTAPRVTLLQPLASLEVTPQALVGVVARVEDDFGVTVVDLQARVEGRARDTLEPISFDPDAGQDGRGMSVVARRPWDLSTLGVQPGDSIAFEVRAKDNVPLENGIGQEGRSLPQKIRIISAEDFERRVREQLILLEERIRRALLEQEDILDHVEALRGAGARLSALTPEESDRLASLTIKEAGLARTLQGMSERAAALLERIEANRSLEPNWSRRVSELARALRDVALGPMTDADAALHAAREGRSAEEQQMGLTQAWAQADAAARALRDVLDEMRRWSDFHVVVARLQDLADRQNELRIETGRLEETTRGKPVESLDEEEKALLERLARRQELFNEEVEKLLERMSAQASSTRENSLEREAMEQAVRQAQAGDLPNHLKTAAENLSSNRAAAAGIDQKQIETTLRKMVENLQDRQGRELEELRKRVERAEDAVANLLLRQSELREATVEARIAGAAADALAPLTDEQRLLKTNTRWVAEELTDDRGTREAGQWVRQAVDPMGTAFENLFQGRLEQAEAAQEDALAALREALDLLTRMARDVREEQTRRTLDRIRQRLEALLEAQRKINEGVDQLKVKIEESGRLGRLEARVAALLARDQEQASERLQEIRPDLQKVEVFDWALERVARWMEDVRSRLARRAVDEDLTFLARRIERELEKLIQSIRDTESMSFEQEFAENDGGGSGQGQGQQEERKPIPAVTELMVLRAMQADLNDRTRALAGEKGEAGDLSEEQLRRLRSLGEDQIELRELTRRLTDKAREEN